MVAAVLGASACAPAAPAQPAAAPAAPATAAAKPAAASKKIIVGLITKTDTNPFFVKMKDGAQAEATAKGATLMAAAGTADGDVAAQVAAIENMTTAGAQSIMITPVSAGVVPAIQKARQAGVMVIALDTPTDPQDASDALFATDNMKAGVLIGQYAKAVTAGKPVKIALLGGAPGDQITMLRGGGFLQGFGIPESDPQVVCSGDSKGSVPDGQTVMENCLTKDPGVNVVYTINEPAAAGAYTALKNRGRDKDVLVVSVDGGCEGVRNVAAGVIGATAQQYPLKMAVMGVDAGVDYATTGNKVSGYTDTGVTLITDKPAAGLDSKDSKFGLDNCWG
ncbi:MAG: substrate-binding domain-containing protein [Chloroflexota bacterium]|nr:substrate-binding domain-containing protein [Chloroflexota bacterium]